MTRNEGGWTGMPMQLGVSCALPPIQFEPTSSWTSCFVRSYNIQQSPKPALFFELHHLLCLEDHATCQRPDQLFACS